jgi:hypothetical protein
MTSKQSDNGQMHRDLINWANIAGKNSVVRSRRRRNIREKKSFVSEDLLVKAF